jgi:hypothetical protein
MVVIGRATIVGVMMLLPPALVQAQLADCQVLGSGSQTYKVVMDELSLAGGATAGSAAVVNLKELLAFNLTTQLEEFRGDVATLGGSPAVELGLINCPGRRPSLNGTEFTPQRVETLSDQRVVVELWGTLLASSDAATAGPHAMIGYVIPPVLHYRPAPAVPGQFLIQYPKAGGDAADVLRKLPEASAFALVGLATKARKARNYDLAVWAFTRSEGRIRDAQQSGGTAELSSLLAYVRRAGCETRQSARTDSLYRGPITLTPQENCGVSP